MPPELGRLQGGAVGGGKQEWQVNLDIAQRTAALLQSAGVGVVDVLPGDGAAGVIRRMRSSRCIQTAIRSGLAHGFKVARPGFSSLPERG